ncbi:MAG: CDP-archaeol synthase [Promethearchaeia archaeon]
MSKSSTNKKEKKERNTKIAVRLAVFFALLILLNFLTISLVYQWADWIALLIFSLLFIVPGYISNAGMVIVGGGKPIDGGRVLKDGRRLFGDHKTWSGFLKGPLFIGIPISIGIFILFSLFWPFITPIITNALNMDAYDLYDTLDIFGYYFIGGSFPFSWGFLALIVRIVLCSYGAAFGDLIGSFLKRRFDITSGEPFWVVDQLDFALFSILFTAIPAFFIPNFFYMPDINIVIFLVILTPAVSVIANTAAYLIGLKDVPW